MYLQIINGWLREGVIICPPCEEICHSEHFALDDKFGYCQETNKDEIPEYVGDVLLDEPCAATTSRYSSIFLFFVLFVRFLHILIFPGIFCYSYVIKIFIILLAKESN